VPVPVLVFLVVTVLGYVTLRYTPYGRHVYAVGGNPEAARLTGLRVDRIVTSVYAIMGFLAGLAGFIQSARLSSAEATAGLDFELTVIASVTSTAGWLAHQPRVVDQNVQPAHGCLHR
jgi:inositol transport system permease protein